MKTILNIFDFDGTLINTQTPETGKIIWEEKTGNQWPHVGWWGRKESLDKAIFEQPIIENVIIEYNRLVNDEEALTIMLTGRRSKLSNEVEAILNDKGLIFDEYRYNYGGDTLSNKVEQIGDLMKHNKSVTEINLFEDRGEHIVTFKQLFKGMVDRGRISKFTIYQVTMDGTLKTIKNN